MYNLFTHKKLYFFHTFPTNLSRIKTFKIFLFYCAGKFVHGFGSVRNFPAMHTVMYEEIDCSVLGLGNDLIIIPCRGPLGIRLGKVSVVAAARDEPSGRDWRRRNEGYLRQGDPTVQEEKGLKEE